MKIICIGRNYVAHAKELGNEVPEEPVIFMKPKTALLKSGASFLYPPFTNDLHYECEVVLRVCKNGSQIPEQQASDYFDAISLGIDFTARDIQDQCKKKGLPWEKAKAFDNSAAVGTFKELTLEDRKKQILFSFRKNKMVVQEGDTNLMIFSFDNIIAHISTYFTINTGDLIFTGTPAGVGPCVQGDTMEAFFGEEKMLEVEVT